jgi:hypothetical protein
MKFNLKTLKTIEVMNVNQKKQEIKEYLDQLKSLYISESDKSILKYSNMNPPNT